MTTILPVLSHRRANEQWNQSWIFAYYSGRFVPFRLFAAKRRHAKRLKDAMQEVEKTPEKRTKRRQVTKRKDAM